jgi:uncharacterized protein
MPSITQAGALNTTALTVPDLYIQIVPPTLLSLNGVPTNVLGIVGVGSWGPVNQPVVFGPNGSPYGAVTVQTYDLATAAAIAAQQGATAFCGVRVTDGTDTAATATLGGLTLTARYTGTVGNTITATLYAGAKSGSWTLSIARPGHASELYPNISGTGAALWAAIAAAVNAGVAGVRGPSTNVVAAGSGTASPAAGSVTLSGGTNGTAGVTAQTLVGADGSPRTGMYALRGQGCSVAVLADATDSTTWTTQAAFGLSEGIYMVAAGPSGDTIANAVSVKQSVGLDSYACKLMFGDWLYWYDQTNQVTRLVSPQAFAAGELANLSPEQSSLNKQLSGITGSQRAGMAATGQSSTYAAAELQTLFAAGIDVICNPAPGGAYWAVRCGHNSSSNAAVSGDNYTRLTNYIASTLDAGMGVYVGEPINDGLFLAIRSTLLGYLGGLLGQGILGLQGGALPYAVVCDASNNPQARTALGYVQADVQVRYMGINEKFIVNLQGGTSVVVTQAAA